MNADELALIETFPAALRHEAETLILRQPYRSRLPVRQGETVVYLQSDWDYLCDLCF